MRRSWRSRRLSVAASSCALALVAAACAGGDGGDGAAGGGECTWAIGTLGALSGDFASLGLPISQGVEFAVNEANQQGDLACELQYVPEDSQGDPTQAPQLARSLVENEQLVAVAGPYFSGETLATGEIFSQAGVLISGTGTNETIDEQGYETWFRAVANDGVQGPTAATYIKDVLKPDLVAVVHDNQDYSKGLAESVNESLGGLSEGPFVINPEETDYSAVVTQVKNTQADVVYYGGYTPQAGPLAKQLKEAGVNAQFFSDDGSKDPSFGELAGAAGQGALVTCPCVDPLKLAKAKQFVQDMRAEFGKRAPGTFATDMYDVTTFIIDALRDLNGDEDIDEVRAAVVDYFDQAEGIQGIAKSYTWQKSGELVADPLKDIWIYRWDNKVGDFVSLGAAEDLVKK